MTLSHQQVLVDTRLAELRQAGRRHGFAAGRGARRPRLQHRLGLLLVEAGLHLLTRTDRGRLQRAVSP